MQAIRFDVESNNPVTKMQLQLGACNLARKIIQCRKTRLDSKPGIVTEEAWLESAKETLTAFGEPIPGVGS
ncbi:hypothetical protein [Vibrio mediterranei]|uniref:hypothetical protein n=1 Tax=Vibrio mediterranei TaxID=689 RepID=UPI00406773F2